MTPDELLNHLEAELARCRDERDRLSAELEEALVAKHRALREVGLLDRRLIEAEGERDRLYGELSSLLSSKSWQVTRPMRKLLGSDRPDGVEGD